MNILFLTQVLPYPADSGPKNKTLNVLKYLSQHHRLILVSFVRGNQEREAQALREICQAVYTVGLQRGVWDEGVALSRSLASRQPWIILRDQRAAMRQAIGRAVAEQAIDAVHADQLNMAQYALQVPGVKRVLDEHNALWLLYKRLWETLPPGPKKSVYGREWRLLRQYEGQVCAAFDAITAVSGEDRQALLGLRACDRPIEVIPITVDTREIQPVERSADARHILHVGTMYWPPNIDGMHWFLEQIYPLIERQTPGLPVDVVGARPPQSLIAAGQAYPGVKIHGYVADVQALYQQAGVFVVPLRSGGGMRVKILEALARGLPVVTTSIGCEGIPVENGQHLLVADSPQEFAQAVLRLIADPALASRLGRNGRQFIESQFDYRVALQALDRIYPVSYPTQGKTEITEDVHESKTRLEEPGTPG